MVYLSDECNKGKTKRGFAALMVSSLAISFEVISGFIVFEFIGACFNWIYYAIRASIAGRSPIRFKDVMSNSRMASRAEKLYGGLPNGIVGLILLVLTVALFVKLSETFGW